MARYRLRFLLQEFDLPRGATLIGRSLDCHVTIEDPLVSRQHARVIIEDDGASIEDLGSRNGVKLNGVTVRGRHPLKDGDRLRIGTQDLVFCRVDLLGNAHAKTTGVLRLCANCRLPYPREVVACPNCEGTEQTDEETLSGTFGADKQHSWSVQLLVEALEKALSLGRVPDAERIVRRATGQVDELLESGKVLDPEQLTALGVAAARVSLESGDPTWAAWIPVAYRKTGHVPTAPVLESLAQVAAKFPNQVAPGLADLVTHLREGAGAGAEPDLLARLEQLHRLLGSVAPSSVGPGRGTFEKPPLS